MRKILPQPFLTVTEQAINFDRIIIVIEKKVVKVNCFLCQSHRQLTKQDRKVFFDEYFTKNIVDECLYRILMNRIGNERTNNQLGVIPLQAINQDQIKRYSSYYNLGHEVVSTLIKISDNDREGELLICGLD